MSLIVRAEIEVFPGQVDAFRQLAEQLAEASESEANTIQYRWFITGDPTRFVVIEEYADQSAAFEHNDHCADLLKKVGRVSKLTAVQFHGDVGAELAQWIDQHPEAVGFPPLAEP